MRRQKRVIIICKKSSKISKRSYCQGRYHNLKKQYKRLVKNKEQAFRKKMLDSISQCEKNNPNLFWDMVNRLRSCKKKKLADNIDPEEWYKWFRDLNKHQGS